MNPLYKKIFIVVAVLFIVVQVGVIAYLLKNTLGSVNTNTVPQEQVQQEPAFSDFDTATELVADLNNEVSRQWQALPQTLAEELAGSSLYFMLTNKGENHEDLLTQAYVFKDGRFSAPETKKEDLGDLYYSFSANGAYGVFTLLEAEKRNLPNVGAEVRTFDYTSMDNASFPMLTETELADASVITRKINPSVSNTGEVLFVGWQKERIPLIEPAEDWTIFKVVNKGAQPLFDGFMPKWVSDTEFVYLANDGMHLGMFDGTSEKLVAPSDGKVFSNNRLDVSSDGTMVAWMQPDSDQIKIYVREGDTFVETAILPDKGYWVAFSPSGKYLAIQTIDVAATGEENNPGAKVEFYDLDTFAKVKELIVNLDAFDQQSMFMTDWVTNN